MSDNETKSEQNTASKTTTGSLMTKFRDLRQRLTSLQQKIRPYQKKINQVRIILYAIAIPWALYIGIKSLPYYAAIGKGESFFKQGLYDDAEREFLACYEQCKMEDPKDPRLARVLNNLGMLYRGTGRYRLAAPYMKETVELAEKYFPKKQELPVSLSNEGSLLNDEGQYVEAEATYNRALQLWKTNIRKDSDTKLASIYNGLARSLREQGQFEKAKLAAQKALDMKNKECGKNSAESAAVLENLGKIAQKEGDFKAAESYIAQALEIDVKAHGEEHPDVASDEFSLGKVYMDEGKKQDARSYLNKSLNTRRQFFKNDHPTVARTLSSLGELDLKEGNLKQAISNLSAALKTQSKFLGSKHPDTLETTNLLSQAEAKAARVVQ